MNKVKKEKLEYVLVVDQCETIKPVKPCIKHVKQKKPYSPTLYDLICHQDIIETSSKKKKRNPRLKLTAAIKNLSPLKSVKQKFTPRKTVEMNLSNKAIDNEDKDDGRLKGKLILDTHQDGGNVQLYDKLTKGINIDGNEEIDFDISSNLPNPPMKLHTKIKPQTSLACNLRFHMEKSQSSSEYKSNSIEDIFVTSTFQVKVDNVSLESTSFNKHKSSEAMVDIDMSCSESKPTENSNTDNIMKILTILMTNYLLDACSIILSDKYKTIFINQQDLIIELILEYEPLFINKIQNLNEFIQLYGNYKIYDNNNVTVLDDNSENKITITDNLTESPQIVLNNKTNNYILKNDEDLSLILNQLGYDLNFFIDIYIKEKLNKEINIAEHSKNQVMMIYISENSMSKYDEAIEQTLRDSFTLRNVIKKNLEDLDTSDFDINLLKDKVEDIVKIKIEKLIKENWDELRKEVLVELIQSKVSESQNIQSDSQLNINVIEPSQAIIKKIEAIDEFQQAHENVVSQEDIPEEIKINSNLDELKVNQLKKCSSEEFEIRRKEEETKANQELIKEALALYSVDLYNNEMEFMPSITEELVESEENRVLLEIIGENIDIKGILASTNVTEKKVKPNISFDENEFEIKTDLDDKELEEDDEFKNVDMLEKETKPFITEIIEKEIKNVTQHEVKEQSSALIKQVPMNEKLSELTKEQIKLTETFSNVEPRCDTSSKQGLDGKGKQNDDEMVQVCEDHKEIASPNDKNNIFIDNNQDFQKLLSNKREDSNDSFLDIDEKVFDEIAVKENILIDHVEEHEHIKEESFQKIELIKDNNDEKKEAIPDSVSQIEARIEGDIIKQELAKSNESYENVSVLFDKLVKEKSDHSLNITDSKCQSKLKEEIVKTDEMILNICGKTESRKSKEKVDCKKVKYTVLKNTKENDCNEDVNLIENMEIKKSDGTGFIYETLVEEIIHENIIIIETSKVLICNEEIKKSNSSMYTQDSKGSEIEHENIGDALVSPEKHPHIEGLKKSNSSMYTQDSKGEEKYENSGATIESPKEQLHIEDKKKRSGSMHTQDSKGSEVEQENIDGALSCSKEHLESSKKSNSSIHTQDSKGSEIELENIGDALSCSKEHLESSKKSNSSMNSQDSKGEEHENIGDALVNPKEHLKGSKKSNSSMYTQDSKGSEIEHKDIDAPIDNKKLEENKPDKENDLKVPSPNTVDEKEKIASSSIEVPLGLSGINDESSMKEMNAERVSTKQEITGLVTRSDLNTDNISDGILNKDVYDTSPEESNEERDDEEENQRIERHKSESLKRVYFKDTPSFNELNDDDNKTKKDLLSIPSKENIQPIIKERTEKIDAYTSVEEIPVPQNITSYSSTSSKKSQSLVKEESKKSEDISGKGNNIVQDVSKSSEAETDKGSVQRPKSPRTSKSSDKPEVDKGGVRSNLDSKNSQRPKSLRTSKSSDKPEVDKGGVRSNLDSKNSQRPKSPRTSKSSDKPEVDKGSVRSNLDSKNSQRPKSPRTSKSSEKPEMDKGSGRSNLDSKNSQTSKASEINRVSIKSNLEFKINEKTKSPKSVKNKGTMDSKNLQEPKFPETSLDPDMNLEKSSILSNIEFKTYEKPIDQGSLKKEKNKGSSARSSNRSKSLQSNKSSDKKLDLEFKTKSPARESKASDTNKKSKSPLTKKVSDKKSKKDTKGKTKSPQPSDKGLEAASEKDKNSVLSSLEFKISEEAKHTVEFDKSNKKGSVESKNQKKSKSPRTKKSTTEKSESKRKVEEVNNIKHAKEVMMTPQTTTLLPENERSSIRSDLSKSSKKLSKKRSESAQSQKSIESANSKPTELIESILSVKATVTIETVNNVTNMKVLQGTSVEDIADNVMIPQNNEEETKKNNDKLEIWNNVDDIVNELSLEKEDDEKRGISSKESKEISTTFYGSVNKEDCNVKNLTELSEIKEPDMEKLTTKNLETIKEETDTKLTSQDDEKRQIGGSQESIEKTVDDISAYKANQKQVEEEKVGDLTATPTTTKETVQIIHEIESYKASASFPTGYVLEFTGNVHKLYPSNTLESELISSDLKGDAMKNEQEPLLKDKSKRSSLSDKSNEKKALLPKRSSSHNSSHKSTKKMEEKMKGIDQNIKRISSKESNKSITKKSTSIPIQQNESLKSSKFCARTGSQDQMVQKLSDSSNSGTINSKEDDIFGYDEGIDEVVKAKKPPKLKKKTSKNIIESQTEGSNSTKDDKSLKRKHKLDVTVETSTGSFKYSNEYVIDKENKPKTSEIVSNPTNIVKTSSKASPESTSEIKASIRTASYKVSRDKPELNQATILKGPDIREASFPTKSRDSSKETENLIVKHIINDGEYLITQTIVEFESTPSLSSQAMIEIISSILEFIINDIIDSLSETLPTSVTKSPRYVEIDENKMKLNKSSKIKSHDEKITIKNSTIVEESKSYEDVENLEETVSREESAKQTVVRNHLEKLSKNNDKSDEILLPEQNFSINSVITIGSAENMPQTDKLSMGNITIETKIYINPEDVANEQLNEMGQDAQSIKITRSITISSDANEDAVDKLEDGIKNDLVDDNLQSIHLKEYIDINLVDFDDILPILMDGISDELINEAIDSQQLNDILKSKFGEDYFVSINDTGANLKSKDDEPDTITEIPDEAAIDSDQVEGRTLESPQAIKDSPNVENDKSDKYFKGVQNEVVVKMVDDYVDEGLDKLPNETYDKEDYEDKPILEYNTQTKLESKIPVLVKNHEEMTDVKIYKSKSDCSRLKLSRSSWVKTDCILKMTEFAKCDSKNKILINNCERSCKLDPNCLLDRVVDELASDIVDRSQPASPMSPHNFETEIPTIKLNPCLPKDPVRYKKDQQKWGPLPWECRQRIVRRDEDGCIMNPSGYSVYGRRQTGVYGSPVYYPNWMVLSKQREGLEGGHRRSVVSNFTLPEDGVFGRDSNEQEFTNFCCNKCNRWINMDHRPNHQMNCQGDLLNSNKIPTSAAKNRKTSSIIRRQSNTSQSGSESRKSNKNKHNKQNPEQVKEKEVEETKEGDEPKKESRKRSIKKMPGIICYICGNRFTKYSLDIHQKTCVIKWRESRKNNRKIRKNKEEDPIEPSIPDQKDIQERIKEEQEKGNKQFDYDDALNELYFLTSCTNARKLAD